MTKLDTDISTIPDWKRHGAVRSMTTGQLIGKAFLRDDGVIQCELWGYTVGGYRVLYITLQNGQIERLL
jgi:hypothetical protein